MVRGVFLDRDGTINVEKAFLHRPEEFEFIPGAPEAIRLLNKSGWRVMVVTNQSGIARGFYDEGAVDKLHRHMDRLLAIAGAYVDAYYFCPHHPDYGDAPYRQHCDCRKPGEGMLRRGESEFSLHLPSCYMIGDRRVDVEAGLRAGCRPIMVRTGYGAVEEPGLPPHIAVFDDLLGAVRSIVSLIRE